MKRIHEIHLTILENVVNTIHLLHEQTKETTAKGGTKCYF